MEGLRERLGHVPQVGRIVWIGARSEHGAPMQALERAEVLDDRGLALDRVSRRRGGKRQVTLVQAEHLGVIGALVGRTVEPAMLRRNVVIEGVNLVALKRMRFTIGADVVLEGTGPCEPCAKMEEALGEGGFHAMRGHGGITARVIAGGEIAIGDPVRAIAYVG